MLATASLPYLRVLASGEPAFAPPPARRAARQS